MENKVFIILCGLLGLINIPVSVRFMTIIQEGLIEESQMDTPMFDASAIVPLGFLAFSGWTLLLLVVHIAIFCLYCIIRLARGFLWTRTTLTTVSLLFIIPVASYAISAVLALLFSDHIKLYL